MYGIKVGKLAEINKKDENKKFNGDCIGSDDDVAKHSGVGN